MIKRSLILALVAISANATRLENSSSELAQIEAGLSATSMIGQYTPAQLEAKRWVDKQKVITHKAILAA